MVCHFSRLLWSPEQIALTLAHIYTKGQEHLEAIADKIKDRPRKGLGVQLPLAAYRELLINSPQHSTEIH